jgi:NAD(P)-dependent dehydrogenase (short-subunit alcohol dehydrogenase family)
MQVKNKRVVVTGAASGIGKALSVAFHEAGAQSVIAVDMNIEGAEETANDVNGIAVEANVGQEKDVINVIEKANELSGGIDIFCSNAGIGGVPGFFNNINNIFLLSNVCFYSYSIYIVCGFFSTFYIHIYCYH